MTVCGTTWGGPGKERAAVTSRRELGNHWTNRARTSITTITATWASSPSWGLLPVSAHHPPLPEAGTREFPPGPSQGSRSCCFTLRSSGTSQTEFPATPCLETREQDVPLGRQAEENSGTADQRPPQAPRSHPPRRLSRLALRTQLGTDVCSEGRDPRAGLTFPWSF